MLYQELSDSGKKYARVMALALLALVFVFGVIFTAYYYASWKQVRRVTKNFQISVSGEGKISVKPDVAAFTFSVRAENAKLKFAQDENSSRSAKVVQFLKSSGVADKDMKTTYYNISPQYQYPRPCPISASYPCQQLQSKPIIIGYEVVSSYEVKIRDLGKAGDIFDGVTSAGATEVNGPSFTVDNPDSAKAETRKIAIENAKAKADVLARDLGVRLGDIVGFSESGNGYPIMFEKAAMSAMGGGMATPVPSIQPGENEIISTVTITYEIR